MKTVNISSARELWTNSRKLKVLLEMLMSWSNGLPLGLTLRFNTLNPLSTSKHQYFKWIVPSHEQCFLDLLVALIHNAKKFSIRLKAPSQTSMLLKETCTSNPNAGKSWPPQSSAERGDSRHFKDRRFAQWGGPAAKHGAWAHSFPSLP